MIKRLYELHSESRKKRQDITNLHRPFANIGKKVKNVQNLESLKVNEKTGITSGNHIINQTTNCNPSDISMHEKETSAEEKAVKEKDENKIEKSIDIQENESDKMSNNVKGQDVKGQAEKQMTGRRKSDSFTGISE